VAKPRPAGGGPYAARQAPIGGPRHVQQLNKNNLWNLRNSWK
jgi:hypothetical protein